MIMSNGESTNSFMFTNINVAFPIAEHALVKLVDLSSTSLFNTQQNDYPLVEVATSSDRTTCIGSVTRTTGGQAVLVQVGGFQKLLFTGTAPTQGQWLVLSSTPGAVTTGSRASAVALAMDAGVASTGLVDAYMLVPNTA
jgi:hypothetical protein